MQTREKKLAIGLGAVVGLMAVWTILKPWYFGPIELEESTLSLVQADLDKLENQQLLLLNATRQLAEWKAKSLPPDPKPSGRQRPDALNGQRLYQEWLTDLVRHCGFRNPEVTPGITRAIQDVYVTAQVRVKAEATYGQVCQFLSLFEQTDLLHRIESSLIDSPNHVGDPLFDVSFVAEGVALQNAPQRDVLFPETLLASAMDATADKLRVKGSDGFPESGRFRIRIGEEFLSVGQTKGDEWEVTRGKDKTKPAAHAAGGKVDLGLYDPLSSSSLAKPPNPRVALISAQNPFTIPPLKGDFRPSLNLPREETVYLGNRLALEAKAESFNPALGPPAFQFQGEVPAGMTISPMRNQPYSGLISWEPQGESQIGSYTVSVQVSRADLPAPLVRSVRLRVREPNATPQIESPGNQIVYSGQPLTFAVKATDADKNQRLTFSLGKGTPPEAAIDSRAGKFSWTPPGQVTEQTLDIEIFATDNGNPAETGTIKVPVEVKADVAGFTRFVGSIADADTGEAWLFDRWNKRNLVIQEGEMMEVADISARLTKVEEDHLLFDRNGETWELELGQDVRDMKPVESPKTAKSN